MAKNSVRDYSATAASNTDVQSVDIDEGCAPSGINNAIREVMADLKNVSTGAVALESPAADSLSVTGNITVSGTVDGRDVAADGTKLDGIEASATADQTGSEIATALNGETLTGIASATVTGDLTVDTNTLYVDSANNNVGIGTASITGALFVAKQTDTSFSTTVGTSIGGSSSTGAVEIFGSVTGASLIDFSPNDGVTDFGGRIFYSHGSDYMAVSTNGSERMRIDSSGNVLVGGTTSPSGSGQIVATGGVYLGGTGAANKLDDYEEGTWTPVADRGTTSFTTAATYSTQTGRYTKIGNTVIAHFQLRFSNNPSGGSGAPVVTGFPFTIANINLTGSALGLTTAITGLNVGQSFFSNNVLIFNNASYTASPDNDYLTGTVIYEVS